MIYPHFPNLLTIFFSPDVFKEKLEQREKRQREKIVKKLWDGKGLMGGVQCQRVYLTIRKSDALLQGEKKAKKSYNENEFLEWQYGREQKNTREATIDWGLCDYCENPNNPIPLHFGFHDHNKPSPLYVFNIKIHNPH